MEVNISSQEHKEHSCEEHVSRLDLYVTLKHINLLALRLMRSLK